MISSIEPSMNTTECSTASSSGWTGSSSGISGKTAAPSALSSASSWSSGVCMSAPSDGGNDADLVAILDRRGHVVQITDVFVVEVDVHEAPYLSVVEQLGHDGGILPAERVEHA